MNDPFEDRFANASENIRMLVESTGVFCVSAENNEESSILSNPLMWAHYGANHAGIAIGLALDDGSRPFTEVRYREESELETEFQKLAEEYQNRTDKNAQPVVDTVFGFKQKFWQYENEYRRVVIGPNRYFDPQATINEVVFGFRTRPEDELATWCALRNGIKYRKMRNAGGNLIVEDYNPPSQIEVGDNDSFLVPHIRVSDFASLETARSPLVPTVTFTEDEQAQQDGDHKPNPAAS